MKDLTSLKEYEESWKNKHILECKNNIFENNLRAKELKNMKEKKEELMKEILNKTNKIKSQESELKKLLIENKIKGETNTKENLVQITKNIELKELFENNKYKVSLFLYRKFYIHLD